MDHDYRIRYGKISLFPMSKGDSESYRIVRNCDENRIWFFQTSVISSAMQSQWYASYLQNKTEYMFSIYVGETFVGGCAIYNVNEKTRSAEFGRIVIGSTYKCHGYAYDAIIGVLNIAKNKLILDRINLSVKRENVTAIRLYEKIGFRVVKESPEELMLVIDLVDIDSVKEHI